MADRTPALKKLELSGKPPFFAEVMRPPELLETTPGTFRMQFWSLKRHLAEFIAIMVLGALAFGPIVAKLDLVVVTLLPLTGITAGYLWLGIRVKSLSRTHACELREGELWAGTPDLMRIGRIFEVISVEQVQGSKDEEWRFEEGSNRIYLMLTDCEPEHATFPLLISQGGFGNLPRQIAAITGTACTHGRGRSEVPV